MIEKLKLMKMKVISFLLFILFIVILLLSLSNFKILIVSGQSMYPTLNDKDFLIVNKNTKNLKTNEIAVFTPPKSWDRTDSDNQPYELIKRIVAGPGDKIKITSGEVYVNDKKVRIFTSYRDTNKYEIEETLKDNQYFFIGDNIGHSYDSLSRVIEGKKDYLVSGKNIKYTFSKEKVGGLIN